MKKNTKADEVKPRQRGPQKEKTQITVRVDISLMNEAQAQMKEDNARITDIVERGICLALRERNHQMSLYARQVRFMVANATKEQQVLLRGLLIAMVESDVVSPTPEAGKLYELVRWFLEGRNTVPHANACMEYYLRFGKSAEEIAELAKVEH
jgi:hypothetical protein